VSKTAGKRRQVRPNQRLWNLGQRSKGRISRIRWFSWFRKFPLKLFLGIICVFLLFEIFTLPIFSIFSLDTKNPKETALMQQRTEEARERGKKLTIDYRWVSLASVPKHVRKAVLIAEDARFYNHAGIDWHEVGESFETNWEERRIVRGGSTITQQLAKNLFLSTSRDPIRKLKELLITWMLEFQLSKKRILELYLNIIEWGPGVFGIEAAAQRHFHKPAMRLTMVEGARLAAVIPSPLRRRPTDDNDYVNKKTQLILKRMSTR
jgi:monofunctional biosynthetic peptidoglycan transglycosylase